ncbi:peptidylprolyl isomerase [Thermococcus sp.]|uniref:FKBP-type peptidyl-prolyl cis-trans isomerase n=1 Tax=Thermococcus sp. TaxID=35749 RepID=UPI00263537CB|nr:peptidylprolyl isomerase [Thermococcus sp.]
MKVERGDRVKFHYVGKFENGEVFDTSYEDVAKEHGVYVEEREYGPLEVTAGAGEVIPGLDEALIGMEVGEKKTVVVPPEKGYGLPNPELVIEVPVSEFTKAGMEPVEGMYVMTDSGIAKIVAVEGDKVKLDFNHPLAGKTLVFEVEVVDVKKKSGDESDSPEVDTGYSLENGES